MPGEYTRGKPLDKEKLAQFLDIAKGPTRTMKQFAEECGVNPSTFSRISNKKISTPCSEAVIRAIYEHKDPNSEFSLDILMAANGMIPYGMARTNRFVAEKTVAEFIMDEMQIRGCTVYSGKRLMFSKSMAYRWDILCVDERFGGNGLWGFDIVPSSNNSYRKGLDIPEDRARRNRMFDKQRFYSRLSRYAAIRYFHPEDVPQRFSFVVYDKAYYDNILEEYGDQKFYDDVSLLLVDIESRKLTEEFIFKRNDGHMMDKFFSISNDKEESSGFIYIDDFHGGDL